MSRVEIGLRPASVEDAGLVADLETVRTPDDPQDGDMVAFWWTHDPDLVWAKRHVADRDGAIDMLVEATRDEWVEGDTRYGRVHVAIHPDRWTEDLYRRGIQVAEGWLKVEGAAVSVATVREDAPHELAALDRLGYREVRRERFWELDLVEHRTGLLAGAERSRAEMRRQGIELTTLDAIESAEILRAIYELDVTTTQDVPTTVPFAVHSYERWQGYYFENPGIRKERFWIARSGDEVVGMSLIVFPPGLGVPTTEFTGTSARHRGKGIARALKYETVVQAIAVGATRVRTDNDSQNGPILHINAGMGYRPITAQIELHRTLESESE